MEFLVTMTTIVPDRTSTEADVEVTPLTPHPSDPATVAVGNQPTSSNS
jgi:muconolactone delta-isomerase